MHGFWPKISKKRNFEFSNLTNITKKLDEIKILVLGFIEGVLLIQIKKGPLASKF